MFIPAFLDVMTGLKNLARLISSLMNIFIKKDENDLKTDIYFVNKYLKKINQ